MVRNTGIVLGILIVAILISLGNGIEIFTTVFANTPWWVYFVLAGIIYSGYRATVHISEEKKVDEAFIEEEGKKYIDKMNDERERRRITRGH